MRGKDGQPGLQCANTILYCYWLDHQAGVGVSDSAFQLVVAA